MPQKEKTFKTKIELPARLKYLLYLPKGYDKDGEKKWPLIVFLHGMGERGDDLEKVKVHGPAKLLETEDWDFVVVSPQCPSNSFWPAETAALNALLDDVLEKYAVDPARVYLTGLSMGGYGTWQWAIERPDRFAAIAPICGGSMFYTGLVERVSALRDVPVWAFHGARDPVVPLHESANLVYALKQAGSKAKFTIYPEADHDAWTETYSNPKLYKWFLKHAKS